MIVLSGVAMAVPLLSGCRAGEAARAGVEPSVAVHEVSIGRSALGIELACLAVGSGERCVLLIASIHGDEPAGTPLLMQLAREAGAGPDWLNGARLLLVTIANPDGYERNHRCNARGVDLNRNFPAESFSARRRHGERPLSEPESRALHDLIVRERPDRIISFHQPVECIDYDGPGESIAHAMSAAMDLEHRLVVRKLGAHPGSLGSWAGEDLGIAVITVELPRSADAVDADGLWRRYGSMIIAGIGHTSNVLRQAVKKR